MIDGLVTFWRTIVDVVALVCLAIVLYDHRDKVERVLVYFSDKLRKKP